MDWNMNDFVISYYINLILFGASFVIINYIATLLSHFIDKEKELTRKRIITLVIPFITVFIVSTFVLFKFLKTVFQYQ